MKKLLIIAVLLGTAQIGFAEEVSVFSAGDLTSSNAYGLTENEQVLLENKKRIDSLQRELEIQNQNLVGLRSVVEGLNSQISKLEARIADLEIKTTGRVSRQASNTKHKNVNSEKKNDRLAKSTQIPKEKNTKSVKNTNNSPKTTEKKVEKVIAFDDMEKEDIFANAKKLFDEKKYTEAKIRYDYLSSKNYKAAEVNFMLGEILYNQKSFSSAIEKYRNSIQIKDNAPYMPILLYHSGLSLEKIGDKTSANKFFSVLKSQYPNSEQAKSLK